MLLQVCHAQLIDHFLRKSPLQTAIENSISPGLRVIRQNYVLRKKSTGEMFSRNNAPEFSYTYSLAVKTANGYYITETAASPWLNDKTFQDLSTKDNYTPVISRTQISPLKEKADYATIDTGKVKQAVKGQKLFFTADPASGADTFAQFANNDGQYFAVWVITSDTTDLYKNTEARFAFYTTTEKEISEGTFSTPATTGILTLGGLVMVADCTQLGVTKFQLAGIMTPDGDGWKAVMLPKSKQAEDKADSDTELTPMETDKTDSKNKKKKK